MVQLLIFRLHSHEVRFGRGAILSVTGYVHDDLGNHWQILE
jgi:dolichyl-phosphate-mannose--protein O-mannosyl transferase